MSDPEEPLETDDVIALEQPDLMGFVREHLDATLESHAQHIDVDDVSQVYQLVLIEVLALSYAVARPRGFPVTKLELLA
jgi:DNA-binding protein Fis